MKIIAIGDIHGREDWKDIVKQPHDVVVFIGDYVDTHEDIKPQDQLSNLYDIIDYKQANFDSVVLLLGNHDYHYLTGVVGRYSGFQGHMWHEFNKAFEDAISKGLFQLVYEYWDILFSHAGITKSWLEDSEIDQRGNFEESFDQLFKKKRGRFGFIVRGFNDPYGNDIYQSPLWIRPESLHRDKVQGYRQVVGHTQQDKLNISNGIAFIDVLGQTGEYLIIENREFKIADKITHIIERRI